MEDTDEGLTQTEGKTGVYEHGSSETRRDGYVSRWDRGLDETTRNQFENFFKNSLIPFLQNGGVVTSKGMLLPKEVSEKYLIPKEAKDYEEDKYVDTDAVRFALIDKKITSHERVFHINRGFTEKLVWVQSQGTRKMRRETSKGDLEDIEKLTGALGKWFLKQTREGGGLPISINPDWRIEQYLATRVRVGGERQRNRLTAV